MAKVKKDWSGTGYPETGLKVDYPEVGAMYGLDEAEAALEAMKNSPQYTLCSYTKQFQEEFARYIGTKYAFAVTNCASALEMAAFFCETKEGDEVIVPAITFYSTTQGILRLGGKVIFADIDPKIYTVTAETIEEKITEKTKAIFVVHLYGLSCNMDPIMELARKHGLKVAEDCAHTPGAEYKGRKTGSIGDFGCFSFHTAKNITTLGEGGMLTMDDDAVAKETPALRHNGMVPYPEQKDYWLPYVYDVDDVRGKIPYNFCMNEIQAAVGIAQLRRVDHMNNLRRKLAAKLIDGLKNMKELQLPYEPEGFKHVYHLFPVLYDDPESKADVNDLIRTLHDDFSIRTVPLYPPVYWFTLYQKRGYKKGLCPVAEKMYNKLLNLPFTPAMNEEQADYMIESVRAAVKKLKNK